MPRRTTATKTSTTSPTSTTKRPAAVRRPAGRTQVAQAMSTDVAAAIRTTNANNTAMPPALDSSPPSPTPPTKKLTAKTPTKKRTVRKTSHDTTRRWKAAVPHAAADSNSGVSPATSGKVRKPSRRVALRSNLIRYQKLLGSPLSKSNVGLAMRRIANERGFDIRLAKDAVSLADDTLDIYMVGLLRAVGQIARDNKRQGFTLKDVNAVFAAQRLPGAHLATPITVLQINEGHSKNECT